MNIFATSPDPCLCALWLDDQRLVKMTLETAQILCTVRSLRGETVPYKPTHISHPCVTWAASDPEHERWLELHLWWLGLDYQGRFDRTHASILAMNPRGSDGRHIRPRSFPNCARNAALGLDFTSIRDPHAAYRAYLNARWAIAKSPPRWTRSRPPLWCSVDRIDPLRQGPPR